MFFESQIFGVIVGAAIGGLTTVLLEVSRRRQDRHHRSQELRRSVHADAVKAVFALREDLFHLFVVTDSNPPRSTPKATKGRGWQPRSPEEERDVAFRTYDESDRKLEELVYLVQSFGSEGVCAALREFGHVTRWYVHKFWQTPKESRLPAEDLENVMEYLIMSLCDEVRLDADAEFGARRSRAKYVNGRPTWLGHLEDMGAYQAAQADAAPPKRQHAG